MKNILLIFLLVLMSAGSQAQWRHTNPYKSTFTDIQFTDYKNGFAVGRDNGIGGCSPSQSALFRTMDGGNTWVRNALDQSHEMTSVFFLTESLGWGTGYYGETYKTTDCGATWTKYPCGIPQNVNDIHFISTTTGFCVAGDGHVRKSTNGGVSWSFNFDAGNQTLYDVHFVNANLGFIAGTSGALLRTTNGGGTWTAYNLGVPTAQFNIAFVSDQHGFVTSNNLIYETMNAGNSWTQVDMPIGVIRAVQFPEPLIGYLGGADGNMMKTTDGGLTWFALETPFRESIYQAHFLDANYGYVSGEFGSIFHTTDGGLTWESQHSGLYYWGQAGVSSSVLGMSFLNADTGMYVGPLGAMSVTYNAGLSWKVLEPRTVNTLNNVQWIDEDKIIAVGNAGTVMRSGDAGSTWDFLDTGYNLNYTKVWFSDDAQTGYAMNYNDSLVKTIDGGNTWSLQILTTGEYLLDMDFLNEDFGMIVSQQKILRTLNGGIDWTVQPYIELQGNFRCIDIVNDTLSFIGAVNILRSINGGAFFDSISVSNSIWADDIEFLTDSIGYIVSGNDVRKTIDGGKYWNSPAIPCWNISFSLKCLDFVDLDHAYAAGVTPTMRLWSGPVEISTYLNEQAFCSGSKLNVGFLYDGAYNSANTYVAQLSDASGSFASPVNIGSYFSPFISNHPSGVISCSIPSNTSAGTGYRIRVIGSAPEYIGTDNGLDLTITNSLSPVVSLDQNAGLCSGSALAFAASYASAGNMPIFEWMVNGEPIQHTGFVWNVDTLLNGDLVQVTMTSSASCASPTMAQSQVVTVQYEDTPELSTSGDVTITSGDAVQLMVNGALNYIWSPSTGLDDANIANPVCTVLETTVYTITGSTANGCTASAQLTVTVEQLPDPPMVDFMASDTIIVTGSSITFQNLSMGEVEEWTWSFEGGNPSSSDLADPGLITYDEEGCFAVTLTATNSVGTDALTKSCYILVNDYCIPELLTGPSEEHHIDGVAFMGVMNLQNGFNDIGYQDFRDTLLVDNYICVNELNSVTVVSGSAIGDYFLLWIDFNGNNEFDLDELLAEANSTEPFQELSLDFLIPDNVTVEDGTTATMRIRGVESGLDIGPCDLSEFGETEDYTVEFVLCEGISELEKSFQLSPNPAHEYIDIRMTSDAGVSFILVDALGRVLDSGLIKEGRARIDVSSYAAGIYVLKVEKGQESFSRKVIIQRDN